MHHRLSVKGKRPNAANSIAANPGNEFRLAHSFGIGSASRSVLDTTQTPEKDQKEKLIGDAASPVKEDPNLEAIKEETSEGKPTITDP